MFSFLSNPFVLGTIGLIGAVFLWVFIAMLFRVVVPTNEVHIIQSRSKTQSYGKDQASGNSYYHWPSWVPRFGIQVAKLPMSVFDVSLEGYPAYDKGRLPFVIDVVAFFRIVDSNLAAQRVSTVQELQTQLESVLQGACRTILAKSEIEEILEGRSTFGEAFTTEVDKNLAEWGVQTVKHIELMNINDAPGSKVIHNIMAKKSSEIDRVSRIEVANNKQAAENAETEANQSIAVRKQEAEQAIGERTAKKDQAVGIATQQSQQAIQEQVKVTMQRQMDVVAVETVRNAEIARDAAVVLAEQTRQTTIIGAEGDKQQMVIKAEGKLAEMQRNAEGIKAEGDAKGSAEQALLMAPVNAQITLAEKIAQIPEYQKYLVEIRVVEKDERVGIEQAKVAQQAQIKVVATGSNVNDGVKNALGLISTPAGGASLGGMLEGFLATEAGQGFAEALKKFVTKPAAK